MGFTIFRLAAPIGYSELLQVNTLIEEQDDVLGEGQENENFNTIKIASYAKKAGIRSHVV